MKYNLDCSKKVKLYELTYLV